MSNTRLARVVPWLVPVAVLSLPACGDDDAPDAEPRTTSGSTSTPPAATDVPISGDFVEILVNADDPEAYGQVEQVPLGQTVVLALLSDTDREYHVHGYDLLGAAPAGVERVFEFTADRAGEFDVEDHVSGEIIRVLEVG
jgi:hypothetical protein